MWGLRWFFRVGGETLIIALLPSKGARSRSLLPAIEAAWAIETWHDANAVARVGVPIACVRGRPPPSRAGRLPRVRFSRATGPVEDPAVIGRILERGVVAMAHPGGALDAERIAAGTSVA